MRRGNPGNSDAGEGPSSGSFRPSTASQPKQREQFEDLVNQFMSTGNIQYLDEATELGSELVLSDEKLLPVLDDLLETQHARQPGSSYDPILRNKTTAKRPHYKSVYARTTMPAQAEAISDCETFFNMYEATQERDYLDSAIGAIEEVFGGYHPERSALFWSVLEGNPNFQESKVFFDFMLDNFPEWGGEGFPGRQDERIRPFQKARDFLNNGRKSYRQNSASALQEPAFSNHAGKEDSSQLLRYTRLPAQGNQETTKKHHVHPIGAMLQQRGDRRNAIAADDLEPPNSLQLTAVLKPIEAMKKFDEIIAPTSTDHPLYDRIMDTIGGMNANRHGGVRSSTDLEQVIKITSEAVTETPIGHPGRALMLTYPANTYLGRYERFGVGGLNQAIKCGEESVIALPKDYPNQAAVFKELGSHYFQRYQRFREIKDLERAIKYNEEALAGMPTAAPGVQNNLSIGYFSRYMLFGRSEDRSLAVKHSEIANSAAATDNPNRPLILSNLSIISSTRFNQRKTTGDFEQAIGWTAQALAVTPIDHPNRAVVLGGLARFHAERYERFGETEDLNLAFEQSEEILTATPLDHPGLASVLNCLSRQYYLRYKRFEAVGDLEQAFKLVTEAIATTRTQGHQRPDHLNNLSNILGARYTRFGAATDLEQAIKHSAESVEMTPASSHDRPVYLIGLSAGYFTRYEGYGKVEDLEQALKWLEEAYTTPMDRDCRLVVLHNLTLMHGSMCERFRGLKNYQNFMKYCQEAMSVTPADHPHRGEIVGWMALAIRDRYYMTDSILDFHHTLRLLYECWHCDTSALHCRVWAAEYAAQALASRRMWQESSSILEDAVKLLSRTGLQLALEKSDQEYRLSRFCLLAANAASVALQAGEDASRSLKILELGRGVIMCSVINFRSDDFDLRLRHPDIHQQFHFLRHQVDLPLPQQVGGNDRPNYQQQRHQKETAMHRLEELLTLVRELPGFEQFQLPLHYNELRAMATDGPIVIINCTEYRSDAIMVTSSSIKSLPLRKLVHTSVEGWMGQMMLLVQGGRRTYEWRNERMKELLLWLWDTTVEPILEALKLDSVISDGTLSPIWWIGVGPLARAPFHAAGDHSPKSTRNTLSRVISSYIPTIKALSYARQKQLKLLNRPDSRLLLVSMPTTPQAGALRNAETEVERIAAIVGQKVCTTSLKHPSTAQVLTKLPSCDAIHFACHGVSNTDGSPSESHLLLRNEDGTQDKLSVRAISEMNLENAQIAFLSACSTAQNSSQILADESIYIASAFQLAGFSHVLATQWMSQDAACLEVATEFYRLLFKDEPSGVNSSHQHVSTAFHYAVKKLRDRKLKHPLIWASFIHTGA